MTNQQPDIFQTFKSQNLGEGVFSLNSSSPVGPSFTDTFKEVNTDSYLLQFKTTPVIPWGTANKFPEELLVNARRCSVLLTALSIYSRHLYGQGFFLYKEVFKDGKRIIEEVDEPEIRKFLTKIKYEKYYQMACNMLPFWGNVVPIFRKDENNKLAQIRIYNTRFCRLEYPDPETALNKNIYVSAQWHRQIGEMIADGEIKDEFKKWVQKIPLLNDYDPAVQMLADNTIKQWALWIKDETTGDDYGAVPWHACHENGWIGIAVGIPKMMEKLFTAAMTINYMMGVDVEYWSSKFQDWDDDTKWDKDSRAEAIKNFQGEIDKHLSGSDNAYKSFMYQILRTPLRDEQLPAIKIEPINNKIREGDNYIPNAQQANAEIVGAVGLDPSMIGYVAGGNKQSAGSGSPIREAQNALTSRMIFDRNLIHEAFEVARDYNWPNGEKSHIKIGTRDMLLNSLDGSRPPAAEVINNL